MKEEKYSFIKVPEEFYYEFFSEGRRGKIKKLVRYRLIEEFPYQVYNLGFGDWNENAGDVDDNIKSNNDDRQKVLATVAETVLDFTQNHPEVFVFAQGSTASRTRLYQMGISSFWDEVSQFFTIIGYVNGEWKSFARGTNYEAFLIKRK